MHMYEDIIQQRLKEEHHKNQDHYRLVIIKIILRETVVSNVLEKK